MQVRQASQSLLSCGLAVSLPSEEVAEAYGSLQPDACNSVHCRGGGGGDHLDKRAAEILLTAVFGRSLLYNHGKALYSLCGCFCFKLFLQPG